jgi:type IV secretory pathway VirJ component
VIEGGRLGPVHLIHSSGVTRGVVIFFGDTGAWTAADEAAGRRLAAAGSVVAGVDLPRYLQALTSDESSCLYLVGDAEKLSRDIERRLGFVRYLSPILAGTGEGGRLALAMLQQTPPSTLAAAVAVDPADRIVTSSPICRQPPRDVGVPSTPEEQPGFVAFSGYARADGEAASVLAAVTATGSRPMVEPLVAASTPQDSLVALLLLYALPAGRAENAMPSMSDLPLIELPASPGAPLAVVLSGDGGWRDIDKEIAEALRRNGYSVLGWDSLRYFWQGKSPDVLGRDLSLAMSTYEARWRSKGILLIGFSFGADVLPFAFNRLSANLRKQVGQISLLSYGGRADFEIRVTGWLGVPPSKVALDAAPEMARINPRLVQCLYGSEEADSACPTLASAGAEVIALRGGHHLGGQYGDIVRQIIRGFAIRSAALN